MQALSPGIMDNGRGSQRFGTDQDNGRGMATCKRWDESSKRIASSRRQCYEQWCEHRDTCILDTPEEPTR